MRTILTGLALALAGAAAVGTSGVAAAAAWGAAGGYFGNVSTDLMKCRDRHVGERFLDGWKGVDENHHVSSALRLAQIHALRAMLARFDDTWRGEQKRCNEET